MRRLSYTEEKTHQVFLHLMVAGVYNYLYSARQEAGWHKAASSMCYFIGTEFYSECEDVRMALSTEATVKDMMMIKARSAASKKGQYLLPGKIRGL